MKPVEQTEQTWLAIGWTIKILKKTQGKIDRLILKSVQKRKFYIREDLEKKHKDRGAKTRIQTDKKMHFYPCMKIFQQCFGQSLAREWNEKVFSISKILGLVSLPLLLLISAF